MVAPSPRKLRRRSMIALLAALLLLTGELFPTASQGKYWGDVGDAPDSTNHHGLGMSAYAWSSFKASFPTVFDPYIAGPQGPLHWLPQEDSWLGSQVSSEADADLGYDEDGIDNIIPPSNKPNYDGRDDSIFSLGSTLILPECGKTAFKYIASAAPVSIGTIKRYVNVWFDFNRDGDWNDILICTTSAGQTQRVYEWAVQNTLVALAPGRQILATPSFVAGHQASPKLSMWMRITLSEVPAPLAEDLPTRLADGRGPRDGYKYGETEDYLLSLCVYCTSASYQYTGE